MMRLRGAVFFIAIQAFAQTPVWDSSGNSMLTGTYYFREVAWVASATNGGALSEAVALYGTINFSGTGTYAISAQYLDGAAGTVAPATISGTYSIGAGGFGFLSHPLQAGSVIRGMVANGIFIGSCTEAGSFNDLFIAGLIPTPAPTVPFFSGSYAMSYMDYSSSNPIYFEDAQFTLNPNGAGSLGNVSIRGFFAGNGTTVTGQVASNVTYIASNGAMVLRFPAANPNSNTLTLVNGNEYLYFSPDGNFVFGGSPSGFDMMIGVRTSSGGAPQLLSSSLYYNAGVYSDATQIGSGALDLDTYYGSFSLSSGTVIQHSRIFSSVFSGIYSAVTTGAAPTTAGNGTYNDPSSIFTVGNGGNVRIGFGIPPYLGIDVSLAAPSFSGTGVYLNPVGVVNAGSYAPFTTGVSPGELITLFGTNLAPSFAQATTAAFPNILNKVQVLIDGIAAPLYYVSPTQISAIVPYAVSTFPIATIQVKNNSDTSNTVTAIVNSTTPGVLTSPANGISIAAALHGDYSLVTEKSPAQPGESISVYLTGLGGVFPPVQDGFPGSSDATSLNATTSKIAALVGGVSATVLYSGLAPGFAGLYQINITIPTGLTAGDNLLDIEGPDSYSSEALIPIGTGVTPKVAPQGTEVQNGQAQQPAQHRKPRPSQKNVVVNPVQP